MEIEFAALLDASFEKLIAEPEFSAVLGVSAQELGSVLSKALARATVSECPREIGEKISSNIVFEFGAVLSGSFPEAKFSPQEAGLQLVAVANALSAELGRVDSGPGFHLSVGGLGHINATPTPEFTERYLAEYSASPDGFRPTSFVLLPGRAVPGFREFESGIELTRSRLLSVTIKKENRDLEEFREKLRVKTDISAPDLLMFLGLLADSEIQVRPYLEGYQSSQNLPWYFERFLRDSALVVGRSDAHTEGRTEDRTSNPDNDAKPTAAPVDLTAMHTARKTALEHIPAVWPRLEELVLQTRYSYLIAATLKRPELTVGHLLNIIRQFYSIYNRPDVRAQLLQAAPEGTILRFVRLSAVAREQVESVLSRLRFNSES